MEEKRDKVIDLGYQMNDKEQVNTKHDKRQQGEAS